MPARGVKDETQAESGAGEIQEQVRDWGEKATEIWDTEP